MNSSYPVGAEAISWPSSTLCSNLLLPGFLWSHSPPFLCRLLLFLLIFFFLKYGWLSEDSCPICTVYIVGTLSSLFQRQIPVPALYNQVTHSSFVITHMRKSHSQNSVRLQKCQDTGCTFQFDKTFPWSAGAVIPGNAMSRLKVWAGKDWSPPPNIRAQRTVNCLEPNLGHVLTCTEPASVSPMISFLIFFPPHTVSKYS